MKLYLTHKTVLSFKNNPASFLNGLTSNTLEAPQNAFLTIHGKIIATFDQIKINDEEFWIVVETPLVEAVLNHLDRYARLSGVKMEKLAKKVYFDLDGDASLGPQDVTITQKRGRLVLTDQDLRSNVKDEEFTLFRLKNNIPLQGVDYTDDFLLNISEVDHVSFTKGCFLGQEPISKVHNRSKPTWKLTVKFEDECTQDEKQKMTSKTLDPESGKVIGFIFVKIGLADARHYLPYRAP